LPFTGRRRTGHLRAPSRPAAAWARVSAAQTRGFGRPETPAAALGAAVAGGSPGGREPAGAGRAGARAACAHEANTT